MRRYELTLTIEVDDDAYAIACDEDGSVYTYTEKPCADDERGFFDGDVTHNSPTIVNWKDTVIICADVTEDIDNVSECCRQKKMPVDYVDYLHKQEAAWAQIKTNEELTDHPRVDTSLELRLHSIYKRLDALEALIAVQPIPYTLTSTGQRGRR